MQGGADAVSFVTRIWLERHSNGEPAWRGHIRHVQTGEDLHFQRLADMCGFIERLTDVSCEALWAGEVHTKPGYRTDG